MSWTAEEFASFRYLVSGQENEGQLGSIQMENPNLQQGIKMLKIFSIVVFPS